MRLKGVWILFLGDIFGWLERKTNSSVHMLKVNVLISVKGAFNNAFDSLGKERVCTLLFVLLITVIVNMPVTTD